MKKNALFILTSFCTSCAYYPQLTDVPLIREKGDTRIELGVATTPVVVRASATYGLTEKIALQVAGNKWMEDFFKNEQYYLQGAVGLFKNIQDRKIMELYGGFGYKHTNISSPMRDWGAKGHLYGNNQIYFAQYNYGGINRGENKKTEFGFGLKLGYMHSKMTDENYYDEHVQNQPPYPVLNMNSIVVEPTVFLRFGREDVKFQTGIGTCWVFQINHIDKKYPFSPITLGFGISYNL